MMTRARIVVAILALIAPVLAAVAAQPAAAGGPAAPPACAWSSKDLNCVHGPTPDIAALPAPSFTTTYVAKTHIRTVTFNAAIVPPYQKCPDGGVPYADLPCSFRGLSVAYRVYVPGATAPTGGATSFPVNSPCDFSCTMQFSLGYNYHGPATIILTFGVGDLLATASNDLTGSSYETTIQLPADPMAGLVHVTNPDVVYSGKLKTMTLALAGKGGIPRTGAAGMLVRLISAGEGQLRGGAFVGDGIGELMVVPGTTIHLQKTGLSGATTIVTLGWYAKEPGTTGDLMHRLLAGKKMKIAPTIALRSAGVPADATGAIVAVVVPKGSVRVGGVLVTGRGFGQYVFVPLKAGAKLSVSAPKGTKLWVYGYTEPVHVLDDGSPLATTSTDQLSNIIGLPDQDTIY